MKNCLVFLTKTFPFSTGEEFIANELPTTAQKFEKVILIATSVPEGAVQTRSVPENVEVHTIFASAVKKALLPGAVKNFFACPAEFKSDLERQAVGHSPLRRLYFSYVLAKGLAVEKKTSEVLAGTSLSDADAVTFYSYWFYDTALAVLLLKRACRAPRCKAISRAHNYDLYPEHNSLNYLPLRPYLLQSLDGVFPCSENGSEFLRKSYPQWAEKVKTSYLGTADRGTGPCPGGETFRLASCCHITPIKRVELFAQALAKLSGSGLKLEWTHFGGGDGLEELKQYASENLGFMKIDFAGEVKNPDLMEFYRTKPVDLFVNTSSLEGLPVSIMEACSFGIPVVATDVGGTKEIVRDGKNGFLLGADFKPETLANDIERICRMTGKERNAMRTASRKIWEENFNAAGNYERFAHAISPD